MFKYLETILSYINENIKDIDNIKYSDNKEDDNNKEDIDIKKDIKTLINGI